jgi:predicted GIY-YIG superfamily endonuclease
MFYLYTLNDPNTLEVRYVGYTKRPKIRLWEHIRDAKAGLKTHKSLWVKSLLNKEESPLLNIINTYSSHTEVLSEEVKLIKELRESGIALTNLTDGGDGQAGVKLKKDHPIISWNKGRKMSLQSRKRLSDSRKNMKFTDEHKKNIARSKLGKSRSIESINKQSITLSQPVEVITIHGESIIFDSLAHAVKFTGVNSNQILKLIDENRKSRNGFSFKKINKTDVPQ